MGRQLSGKANRVVLGGTGSRYDDNMPQWFVGWEGGA